MIFKKALTGRAIKAASVADEYNWSIDSRPHSIDSTVHPRDPKLNNCEVISLSRIV